MFKKKKTTETSPELYQDTWLHKTADHHNVTSVDQVPYQAWKTNSRELDLLEDPRQAATNIRLPMSDSGQQV